MSFEPGEILLADTAFGRRPAIVLSREELNRGETVVVVLCTSSKFDVRSKLPNCVAFRAGQFGFTKDCIAQDETVQHIEILFLDHKPIGVLTAEKLREVIRAVGFVMDADCEPV